MSTIQATHGVREEVDATPSCVGLELAVELFGAGGDGACSRHGGNDHLRPHRSSQDAEDVGPVVHTHTWEIGWSARVESV